MNVDAARRSRCQAHQEWLDRSKSVLSQAKSGSGDCFKLLRYGQGSCDKARPAALLTKPNTSKTGLAPDADRPP
ncbi:hypothetical protein EB234_13705 [Mesorhizobium japonicum R7A]|uniref:Uncharacterized protein n=1 Tax=Mesorhizobium japonicum TaxID=2066070 RepID=A0A3M9XGZ6_9HYPH|nr:hypothetical protein EB234_13705 [Mesorhizobium japonicum R7A]RNJ47214.1 hypothetical protein DNR46_05090 [Mesorhizobium japonicum]